MTQDEADAILEVIDKKGWYSGRGYRESDTLIGMGPVCLAMAACEVAEFGRSEILLEDLSKQCRELFPDRKLPEFAYPRAFNDHPQTTLEDVKLVVKHSVDEC